MGGEVEAIAPSRYVKVRWRVACLLAVGAFDALLPLLLWFAPLAVTSACTFPSGDSGLPGFVISGNRGSIITKTR